MRKPFNLVTAIKSVDKPEVEQLTFSELARGYCDHGKNRDPNDQLRLRKWIEAFGDRPAWQITSAEIATAALAMSQGGYKASTVNRDVASVGSCYKWAVGRRVTPLGFVSPTIGLKRFSEGESIRRIDIAADDVKRLKALSLLTRDRRFGVFVHPLWRPR